MPFHSIPPSTAAIVGLTLLDASLIRFLPAQFGLFDYRLVMHTMEGCFARHTAANSAYEMTGELLMKEMSPVLTTATLAGAVGIGRTQNGIRCVHSPGAVCSDLKSGCNKGLYRSGLGRL